MAFTDELTIHVKAGKGGDGVVRWLHEKGKEFSGAAGGNGGRGGNVFVVPVRDTHLLSKYKAKKIFEAGPGEPGGSKSLHGANGADIDIELPLGSIVTNVRTGQKIHLVEQGEKIQIAKGGTGGRGNESFKSSTNQTPLEFTLGEDGEEDDFYIELELVADIGLIGLPNAGKTSILNELTNSTGKVGNYPFTTLEPNLGDMYGFIIADIPGLIEGASEGTGLGHKFLRHVRRTKMLAHLISLENEDLVSTYKIIRKELQKFDKELVNKKEVIVLTKTDLITDRVLLKQKISEMEKIGPKVLVVSVYDDDQIKDLREELIKDVS